MLACSLTERVIFCPLIIIKPQIPKIKRTKEILTTVVMDADLSLFTNGFAANVLFFRHEITKFICLAGDVDKEISTTLHA